MSNNVVVVLIKCRPYHRQCLCYSNTPLHDLTIAGPCNFSPLSRLRLSFLIYIIARSACLPNSTFTLRTVTPARSLVGVGSAAIVSHVTVVARSPLCLSRLHSPRGQGVVTTCFKVNMVLNVHRNRTAY